MVISSRLILAQFIAHIGRTACADVAAPPRKRFRSGAALCVAALACGACRAPDTSTLGTPGAPLPGLTPGELLEFHAGRALFEREFAAPEGLGPAFNESRCSACHDVPTTGGMGAELVRKATRFEGGRCDLLTEHGGDLIQSRVTEAMEAAGYATEPFPREANAQGLISGPALYGLGLLEAIPERAIMRNADPDDRDRDGISGRPGRARDGRLGRFGRKADVADIRSFTASALVGELGLTTAHFPHESTFGGRELPAGVDPKPDPEIDETTLERLTRFIQGLAVPAGDSVSSTARDSIRQGYRLFRQIGCADCHIEQFETGNGGTAAVRGKTVRLFSDLLLHDLGPERASICAEHATPGEWRTTPLMGLRWRHVFWHDGQVQSLESAVTAHDGEAAGSRTRFQRLTPQEQAMLFRFLRSL